MGTDNEHMGQGLVEGIIGALVDKQGQVDLHLRDLTLAFGDSRLAVHLSGTVTLSVHMRDLTDEEKQAHSRATIKGLPA
jgi:hypothetical protein